MEPNFNMFVENLTLIFKEVKRVMKPTGTVWVNIADSYGGSGHGSDSTTQSNNYNQNGINRMLSNEDNQSGKLQSTTYNKSLLGIPDRFKTAMIDMGYKCRNEIIWHKPNQTPQSAKDRFTNDFEKIYFFTLEDDYYFNQQFEPFSEKHKRWGGDTVKKTSYYKNMGVGNFNIDHSARPNSQGRNMRTVWSIPTQASGVKHFATFPSELPRRCIKAGCPKDGVVIDIFSGSGTTLVVAKELGVSFYGIELNPQFIQEYENRKGSISFDIDKWINEAKNDAEKDGHALTQVVLGENDKYYAKVCPRTSIQKLLFKSCWHIVAENGRAIKVKSPPVVKKVVYSV